MSSLHNRVSREEMRQRLHAEPFRRITLSFYRYVILNDPKQMRDTLWREWSDLGVFGRIYVAREGINAQLSVPEHHFEIFRKLIDQHPEFNNVPFKIAVEDDGKSFFILTIKVRAKIVADGLPDDAFDVTNVGTHLTAAQFNAALDDPDAVVVDLRNQYESEVGHFENAILPPSDSFKEELEIVQDMLKGQEDKKLLLYCTGGIRCEKASAWFKHQGFTNVNQLHGGIIDYARQIKQQQLPSRFIGKNFVFDERLGERITEDVIAKCHQCETACDTHTNCANDDCHTLFIQCPACAEKYAGCCSKACRSWNELPEEERAQLRAEGKIVNAKLTYGDSFRPRVRPETEA